jgi:hypothetical protein
MKSENQLVVELTRYYQQKIALITEKAEYEKLNKIAGYNQLMSFYDEKIASYRKTLKARTPFRLDKIDKKFAKEIAVFDSEIIE